MDTFANAALTSWALNPPALAILFLTAIVYVRGWLHGRQLLRSHSDHERLAAFLAGLLIIFLATESPLDAFDTLYLSAHMAQHLLLMMFAPPLVLLGRPTLPLLRGLPRKFVKEGLAPFLTWPALKAVSRTIVFPPVAWSAFTFSTVFWHLPKFYELALRSPFWHGAQHASFFWTGILFWWPIIQPTPAKPQWPAWTKIPYLLFADILNTVISAFFVFSGRILYPSYALASASSFKPQDDQTVAGLIMWVPGSLIYLVPAFILTMRLLSSGVKVAAPDSANVRRMRPKPITMSSRALVPLRRAAQTLMLFLAIAIIADGFLGPQAAPLNLAGILPWIHWRALSILALLVLGNLFCMACPFMLVRDASRRFLPATLRWPRQLRNKWLALVLFVLYLWCYEVFGLWDNPFLTAWITVGYFAAAVLIDGVFRGASFCKYVCPIGQFHFIGSLISPREVKIKSAGTCQTCRTYDCIRGNTHSRGCELYLFQPKKAGNLDCTFCLDCVNACPHDNVGILPVIPAKTITANSYRSSIGRLARRTDLAAFALVFVFGAFANAAGMVAPVMMFEHEWHARLGQHALPLIVGTFLVASVILLPIAAVSLCSRLNRFLKISGSRFPDLARQLILALVPLGFAMWGSHLLYHFATGWNSISSVILQRFVPAPGALAEAFVPSWMTAAQILLLGAGLLLTLYISWRLVLQAGGGIRRAFVLLSPWATLAFGLYCAGAWILFQPMQMRGIMN